MTNNINNFINRNNLSEGHNTHPIKEMPPDVCEAQWNIIERHDCYNKPYKVFQCSNCGAVFSEAFAWLTYYNYCPHCGSHMHRSDWDEVEKSKSTRTNH